jgi:hypothetical protein
MHSASRWSHRTTLASGARPRAAGTPSSHRAPVVSEQPRQLAGAHGIERM